MSEWRHPGERRELVERVIAAEKATRIAEAKCRVLMAQEPRDEITRLAVRLVELEDDLARANARIAELNTRLRRTA